MTIFNAKSAQIDFAAVLKMATAQTLARQRGSFTDASNDNARTIVVEPFEWRDPATIPRRAFLYGSHFIRKELSATVSPGGLGKSSHALVEALAMVTNRPLLGECPKESGLRVFYANAEDDEQELRRRVQAAMIHYKIAPEDIGDRLFIHSADSDVFTFAREERDGVRIIKATSELVIEIIEQNAIDVVILDPFISFHSVDGNSNQQMQPIVTEFKRIARETDVSFELIAHTRKGNGRELTQDDAMGAAALVNKTRSTRVLNAMTPEEAAKAGVDQRDCAGFFRITNPKNNLAPSGDSKWRRMIGVDLGNGGRDNGGSMLDFSDKVGVATRWEWPSAESLADGVTPDQLQTIKADLAGLEGKKDVQSPDWAGYAVMRALGMDETDKAQRPNASKILTGLIAAGHLKVEDGPDHKTGKIKKFVTST
jgi:hypothetical protein